MPDQERQEIKTIYTKKGFSGTLLDKIVQKITSSKKLWLDTMMKEELHLEPSKRSPGKSAGVVGLAAIIGSLIPLLPFFFVGVRTAIGASVGVSIIVLFATGFIKGRLTTGREVLSGIEMALIGSGAAVIGFVIGSGLGLLL